MKLNKNLLKQLETAENKYIACCVYYMIEYLLHKVATEENQKTFTENHYWVCINFYKKEKGFDFLSRNELEKGIKTLIEFGYIQRKTIENKYYFSKTDKCLML